MLPDWLRDPAINTLISLLALIVTIFSFVFGSDKSEKFIKNIFLLLGRATTGTLTMALRLSLQLILIGIIGGNKPPFEWQGFLSIVVTPQVLISILASGSIVAVFTSRGSTFRLSIKNALISSIIVVLLTDIFLVLPNQNITFFFMISEFFLSTIAGFVIALLLNLLRLRIDPIQIIPNPLYN